MNVKVVVDIGNTQAKAAIFEGDKLAQSIRFNAADVQSLQDLLEEYKPTHSLLCTVAAEPVSCVQLLVQYTDYKRLSPELAWPFRTEYTTPHTLGSDRVAGVAGSMVFFPNTNCLVIDAGTCITYDMITHKGIHLGGAIAPGLQMRLNAMHHFTQKLPKLDFEETQESIGHSSKDSMLSGTYFGMLSEINGFIERYEAQVGPLQVLICGGDAHLFDKHAKKDIFAAPDLVLYGLNKILELNA